jgi:hypothetical protein
LSCYADCHGVVTIVKNLLQFSAFRKCIKIPFVFLQPFTAKLIHLNLAKVFQKKEGKKYQIISANRLPFLPFGKMVIHFSPSRKIFSLGEKIFGVSF